jgi:hypothetical protein
MFAASLLGSALALVQPVADWESSIQDPGRREAMRLCVPSLSARAKGEVTSVNIARETRSGSRTVLEGQMRVLLRPSSAGPGEMAPMHIINARFTFRCSLRGSRVVGARVSYVPN